MKVNRERQMKTVRAEAVDIVGITLQTALEEIQYHLKKYGKDSMIEKYNSPYNDYENLYVFHKRPETDEEMRTRISDEEHALARNIEHERATYEALKAKYGSE
jgi:CTP:phosphocholine cytidylyltransferase-like protein